MKPGDRIPLDRIHADQHFTQPPPRFTEAALVKALEEYGIGRPSTYASIIQTLRSEEHTSELQSLMRISYAVFCLKKKNKNTRTRLTHKHSLHVDTDNRS